MPYREQFATENYYHIINRGIEGRKIFLTEEDYGRFLESLEVFNTLDYTTIQLSRKIKSLRKSVSAPSANHGQQKLVKILCFCLLPNHFHLLLKQVQENGIVKFMRKIGTGYACYFNLKYQHNGPIFSGRFKSVRIRNDEQFIHVSRYIHLNVLDLYMPNWRNGNLQDWVKAKQILESYPWSSYPIFINKTLSNFCFPELLREIFRNPEEYEEFVKEWTQRSLINIQNLILE